MRVPSSVDAEPLPAPFDDKMTMCFWYVVLSSGDRLLHRSTVKGNEEKKKKLKYDDQEEKMERQILRADTEEARSACREASWK